MMMHQTQLANQRRHPSPLTFGWSAISFILLALLTLLAAPQQVAHAGDSFTWTGEGDGITWTDACNWHPKDVCKETYPGKDGDDDSATIMSVAAHVIHPGSVTLDTLVIKESAALQGGDITVTRLFVWESGSVAAHITIPASSIMAISSDGDRRLEDLPSGTGQIDLYGAASWTDGGTLNFLGDTIINNYGAFVVSGQPTFYGYSCCEPPTSNFNNFGQFTVVAPSPPQATSAVTLTAVSFVHKGVVEVADDATLTLGHGNHLFHDNSSFTGSGHTVLAELSGNPTVDGTVQLAPAHTFELRNNDLAGTGAFAGGGTFEWTGGEVRGNLTIAADTTLLISGVADKRLTREGDSGEISAFGDVQWHDASRIIFAGPAIFNIHGTFQPGGLPAFQALSCCVAPVSAFNNFGTLTLQNTAADFQGVFFNTEGTVEIVDGQLHVTNGARYDQSAGLTKLDNAEVTASGGLHVGGGLLQGTGVITGTLANNAEVAPGLETGILKVTGTYTQSASATLSVEIAGLTPGAEFDQLDVSGEATLAGVLNISRPGGFLPEPGDNFAVLNFGSRSGNFGSYNGLDLGNGTAFTPLYHSGDLTLTVGEQTGNLTITEMTLNHQSVADGQWVEIGDDGTIDGNQVRVSATVANDGPARSATMQLVEADTGTELTSAAPVDLPTGASTVELDWDTTGYAWAGSAEPRSDLQLELHLESADATATQSASILVAPKPVVLVHGLWSDANAWSSYGAFLSNRHPHWRAYAVGDGQFPGVMDTGSLLDPFGVPNTIYENAEILAGYVQALRESRNAWQVDIVAHSLGGLISRQYIQSFMPDLPDDQRAVHQLLMLGTPNLGSQCALDFPFIATYELRPDVVASFNGRVDDQHGVPFSILAGNPLPFTCSALVTGDMVVPVDSAFALPYVTDQQLTGSLHIFMNGSQADFDNFVLPRLALGPGSSRPEQATTANLVMTASLETTAPSPQLIAVETVQIADLLDVALPVPPGDRFGVTLLAPASVAVFLEDHTGALVQSIASDDPLAQEPIRAFNIANPATGAWNLRLENSGPEPATAVIIAWIQGNPLLVQLDAGAPAGTGQIALSVNVADGDTPVTQATVHATLTATSGEQHQIELHDNGLNGDDAAGDGIYSAILHSFTTDEYLVVVEASTPTVWRATTGSITVNANTHYLFLPLMRQSH